MSADQHSRFFSDFVRFRFGSLCAIGFLGCLLSSSLTAHAQGAGEIGEKIPGVVIGYDSAVGLLKYSFATGKVTPLLRRRAESLSDSLRELTFDVETKTLFYVDLRHSEVRQWKSGAATPETIYKIPKAKIHQVEWIVLSPDGKRVFFIDNLFGGPTYELLVYDRKTRKTSVVTSDFLAEGPRPAWISKSHMLVTGRFRLIADGEAEWRIFDVDVSTGKRKPLRDLGAGTFALSPNSKMLAVLIDDDFRLYTFPDLEFVRGVPRSAKGIMGFCFAGNDHFVISVDPLNGLPAKAYIVNVNTGDKRVLFRGYFQGMSYLPVEPDWVEPDEDAARPLQ